MTSNFSTSLEFQCYRALYLLSSFLLSFWYDENHSTLILDREQTTWWPLPPKIHPKIINSTWIPSNAFVCLFGLRQQQSESAKSMSHTYPVHDNTHINWPAKRTQAHGKRIRRLGMKETRYRKRYHAAKKKGKFDNLQLRRPNMSRGPQLVYPWVGYKHWSSAEERRERVSGIRVL